MYWIEYNRFIYLGSYSRPHIIGIKACWFGYNPYLYIFCSRLSWFYTFIPQFLLHFSLYCFIFMLEEENVECERVGEILI